MNKDQAKGAMKDLAGKAQRKAGDVTDNPEHQAKGAAKQAEGKVQKGYGDVKQAAENVRDENKDE